MKLVDLRKIAIRQKLKIHFRLGNGMECVVNDQGVAELPGFRGRPDFRLEEELAAAGEFLLEPAPPAPARKLGREEMAALAAGAPAAARAHDREEE